MNGEIDDLGVVVGRELERLVEVRKVPSTSVIVAIVRKNLESGRLLKVLDEQSSAAVADYVARVARFYDKWRDCVYLIQVEQDEATWQDLFEQLQKWAYHLLRKMRMPYDGRLQHAVDCAAEAGAVIASSRYPYDADFEAWSYVLLRNVCYRHLNRLWNGKSISEQNLVHADRWDGWLEARHDPVALAELRRIEMREVLTAAIALLPSGQQEALVLHCLEGKTYDEISELTGRTKAALYKATHQARERLRVSLAADFIIVT